MWHSKRASKISMLIRIIRWPGYLVCDVVGCAVVWGIYAMAKPVDEVVLTLREPYEQIREHSRSTLQVAAENNPFNLYRGRPTIFWFGDPQFGFVHLPSS